MFSEVRVEAAFYGGPRGNPPFRILGWCTSEELQPAWHDFFFTGLFLPVLRIEGLGSCRLLIPSLGWVHLKRHVCAGACSPHIANIRA